MTGAYMMYLETTWTYFFGPLKPHLCLCLPPSYIKILFIINTYTSPMSLFNHSKSVKARDLKFWHNNHHTIFVICPVSRVRWQMSLIICHMYFFFRKCWSKLQEGQHNLPCQVLRLFLLKTCWYIDVYGNTAK